MKIRTFLTLLALTTVSISGLYSQGVGAGLGYLNDLSLSARVEFNITDQIELAPSFNFFLADGNPWSLHVDGHYDLNIGDSFAVYPIAGMHLLSGAGDTELGLDLGAGVNFNIQDRLRFYLEANYLAITANDVLISAGVMLPIGN